MPPGLLPELERHHHQESRSDFPGLDAEEEEGLTSQGQHGQSEASPEGHFGEHQRRNKCGQFRFDGERPKSISVISVVPPTQSVFFSSFLFQESSTELD